MIEVRMIRNTSNVTAHHCNREVSRLEMLEERLTLAVQCGAGVFDSDEDEGQRTPRRHHGAAAESSRTPFSPRAASGLLGPASAWV